MVEHKNDLSKYKAYNARYKLYDPFDGVASREKGATTATTTTAKATEDINNSNSHTKYNRNSCKHNNNNSY